MFKRTVQLGTFVVLLVGCLVYWISPGELQTVYATVRDRVSANTGEVLAAILRRPAREIHQVGATPGMTPNMAPARVPPAVQRYKSVAGGLWVWLKGPQSIPLWVSIMSAYRVRRYLRRRRLKLALEGRMAVALFKALRQM